MTNQDVLIDGEVFEAVQVVELTRESEIVDHPVESLETEKDITVTDHIFQRPRVLSVELKLFNAVSEVPTLRNRLDCLLFLDGLYQNKNIFTFACDLGKFDNMVVQSLSLSEDKSSSNVFFAKMTLREIQVVTSTAKMFQYVVDDDGTPMSGAPIPSDTETVALYKPGTKKEEDQSLWDQVVGGLSWAHGEYKAWEIGTAVPVLRKTWDAIF